MDNYKIGKLIKKLRKENHLTQAELGEKVGVGDRAVSKWERGLTCPDISIINDLSKILGITSTELLAGELKPKTKEALSNKKDSKENKTNSKSKRIIIIIISLILICIPILLLLNNKTYVYDMTSIDPEYAVKGKVIIQSEQISIMVSELKFKDKELLKTIIKNYEYEIKLNDEFVYRYGYIYGTNTIENPMKIVELAKIININHLAPNNITKIETINNKITINFKFLDENNQEITKEINIELKEIKK